MVCGGDTSWKAFYSALRHQKIKIMGTQHMVHWLVCFSKFTVVVHRNQYFMLFCIESLSSFRSCHDDLILDHHTFDSALLARLLVSLLVALHSFLLSLIPLLRHLRLVLQSILHDLVVKETVVQHLFSYF